MNVFDSHIDESKLIKFVFAPDLMEADEKISISKHFSECRICNEQFEILSGTKTDIENRNYMFSSQADDIFIEKITGKYSNNSKKLLPEPKHQLIIADNKIQIREETGMLSTIFSFFFATPARGFSFLFMITAAIILFTLNPVNENPHFAEIKNHVLRVYNIDNQLIWQTTARGIPDNKSDSLILFYDRPANLRLFDIDGDKQNEILLWGSGGDQTLFSSDSLYCFDNSGNIKWRAYIGVEFLSFANSNWKHLQWNILDVIHSQYKGKSSLIIAVRDRTYAPAAIVKMDARSGKFISAIYMPGFIFNLTEYDIDGDNNKEILVGGVNNGLRRATLTVLNPERIEGIVPSTSKYYPNYLNKGSELYYVKLPWSDLGRIISPTNFNTTKYILPGKTTFVLFSYENYPSSELETASVLYTFDRNMNITDIIGSVGFVKQYDDRFKKGLLKKKLDEDYYNALRDSIEYWDGDKFVNYSTKNSYWNKPLH